MQIKCLVAALLVAFSAGVSQAATIDYNVSGVLYSGSFNGYVLFDTQSKLFTGGNITALDGTAMDHFTTFSGSGNYSTGTYDFLTDTSVSKTFALGILTTDLQAGKLSGQVCSGANVCGIFISGINTTQNNVSTGTYSVTPEPSSLVLLGTGLLGVVSTFRKRFV